MFNTDKEHKRLYKAKPELINNQYYKKLNTHPTVTHKKLVAINRF